MGNRKSSYFDNADYQRQQNMVEQQRALRAQIRFQREQERVAARAVKETKQKHLSERAAQADESTRQLQDRITELTSILAHTLKVDDTVQFDSLRIREPFPSYQPPSDIATPKDEPHRETFYDGIKPPNAIARLLPGAQKHYEEAIEAAGTRYKWALRKHEEEEELRRIRLAAAYQVYIAEEAAYHIKVTERDREVDELRSNYMEGDPNAVVAYNTMVLERSEYPDGFPQEFRVAFVPESQELVIEYELPSPDIVPKTTEHKYVKTKDRIEEKPRKASEIKDTYQDIVAMIALRTCHELFEADQGKHIQTVVFSGFVQTIDPATGKDIRPFLISIRVTKDSFAGIDLARVDKKACLRNLGAQVSPRAYEVQPVKPIIEFDMVDKRFVEQSDIFADLESRPNLMDLNPYEFENLCGNLFEQLGLQTKLTRSSRDGGVDVVAFDVRPILGGKVVIQAKRYKNTVGVSAVRDLYGTMMNEGANKGILVTTSGYGPDAFDFSKDKPIELIDGGQLLYLLNQVGVKARIIFPDDWQDQ